jgi:hypothetical protein
VISSGSGAINHSATANFSALEYVTQTEPSADEDEYRAGNETGRHRVGDRCRLTLIAGRATPHLGTRHVVGVKEDSHEQPVGERDGDPTG